MAAQPLPIASAERLESLDVLRGLAVFGILIANMLVFSGYFLMDQPAIQALSSAATDRIAIRLIHTLVEAKFYSIFSLLFGFGFAIQLGRADAKGAAFPVLFRRRLTGLLLIGMVHAFLIWAGDILLLYAVLGFLLVPFHRAADRTVLRWAVACLAMPVAAYLLMLAFRAPDPFASVGPGGGEAGNDLMATLVGGFRDGSWLGALRSNLIAVAGRWFDLFVSVRFPKVFGMFLLGFYLGRQRRGTDPARDRPLLRRALWIGLLVGLPANIAWTWLLDVAGYLPATALGLAGVTAAAIGVPLLALGYAAAVVLALETPIGRRLLAPVGQVGRMALTNYLLHSIVMTTIFYGWGLGYYMRIGPAWTTAMALVTFLVQIPLSRLWLTRYRFGPVEWIWRQFTYRRRLVLRRATAT